MTKIIATTMSGIALKKPRNHLTGWCTHPGVILVAARNPNGSDIKIAKTVPTKAIMSVSIIELNINEPTLQSGGFRREKNSENRGPELNRTPKSNSNDFIDNANNHILSTRVAEIFSLPNSAILILITAIVGGLIGGFGALTGSQLRNIILPARKF